jgi:hypothetical protein
MKLRSLQLTLLCAAWIVPAAAETLSAPSTLPGQNAAIEIEVAPPVAMPIPVQKPQRSAPMKPSNDMGWAPGMDMPADHLDARKTPSKAEVIRAQENAGTGASPISGSRTGLPQRPALTPAAPASGTTPLPAALRAHVASNKPFRSNRASSLTQIEGVALAESPNGDTAKLSAAFSTRLRQAEQDDSDLAELGINAKQFSAPAPALTARMQTTPVAGTQRVMGAPGSSAVNATNSYKIQAALPLSTTSFCEVHQGNKPQISRILPARDTQIAPDEFFAVKGVCFGDAPGTVEIRFNTTPAQVYKARVINWTRRLVHVQLPENISGVIPQNVDVVLTTQDNRVAPRRSIAFWPRWEKVQMDRYARVTACWSDPGYPHTRSSCSGARDTVSKTTNPFDFPGRERGGLSALDPFIKFGRQGAIHATHYTEEDLAIQPVIGTDRWTFDLPRYAIYAGWRAEYESFVPSKNGLHISVDESTRELLVRWHMAEMGEEGFLGYNVDNIQVWLPVGVFKR